MIKTFVLIMVISQGASQGGNSSLSVEFYDESSCIKAMRIIKADIEKDYSERYASRLVSYGCYPLGDK